ncbi:MAG: MFS transporter, partial [Gammaproteobacteria bacterium]
LVLIFFAIGSIFSRLVWGPVSDMKGRRRTMLVAIGIQVIGQTFCTFAPTIETLLIARSFQSLGAGVSSVLATAIIADLFHHGNSRARMFSLLEMSFPIAYVLAPILGAFLVESTGGWRANFGVMLVIMMFSFILVYRYVPESHEPNKSLNLRGHFRQYIAVMKHLEFLVYGSIVGLIVCSYMIFVVNAPFIYINDLGLSVSKYALYQLIPMIFNFGSAIIFRSTVNLFDVDKLAKFGMYMFSLLIPGYLILGFSSVKLNENLIVAVISYQSFVVSFIIPGFTAKALEFFREHKGVSSSLLGSIRSLMMSLGMLAGGYVLGSHVKSIFIAMGFISVTVVAFYLYVTSVKSNAKSEL